MPVLFPTWLNSSVKIGQSLFTTSGLETSAFVCVKASKTHPMLMKSCRRLLRRQLKIVKDCQEIRLISLANI